MIEDHYNRHRATERVRETQNEVHYQILSPQRAPVPVKTAANPAKKRQRKYSLHEKSLTFSVMDLDSLLEGDVVDVQDYIKELEAKLKVLTLENKNLNTEISKLKKK